MTTESRMVTECFTSFAGGRQRHEKIRRFAARLARREANRRAHQGPTHNLATDSVVNTAA